MGICKNLGVSEKYALYDISFLNALMYSYVIPIAGGSVNKQQEGDDAPLFDESKDACDPANFKNSDLEEEKAVRFVR